MQGLQSSGYGVNLVIMVIGWRYMPDVLAKFWQLIRPPGCRIFSSDLIGDLLVIDKTYVVSDRR